MYKVHLNDFEGPLDLLLFFIRRDELDIYDIPISKITSDYMDTIQSVNNINISLAGDFIHMAATLMRIKSKMMIPQSMDGNEEDIEDPRMPLVRQLLEYKRFRDAALSFNSLADIRSSYFSRGKTQSVSSVEENPDVFLRNVSIFDIAKYFKSAIDNRPVITEYELKREQISIEDQKAKLLAYIDGDGFLSFSAMMKYLKTKIEIIITFLAILDLIRESKILVIQNKLFSDLEIQVITEIN